MFGPPIGSPLDPRPSGNSNASSQSPFPRINEQKFIKRRDVKRIWHLRKALVEDRQKQDKTTLATHDRSA
jgi:hypothetical protein